MYLCNYDVHFYELQNKMATLNPHLTTNTLSTKPSWCSRQTEITPPVYSSGNSSYKMSYIDRSDYSGLCVYFSINVTRTQTSKQVLNATYFIYECSKWPLQVSKPFLSSLWTEC